MNTFKDDNWTFGKLCNFKNMPLTVDLYSRSLQVIIEYDGVWHFKDINGQLKRKQYKDQLLEEWCLQHNWKLVRIKDTVFESDSAYWMSQLAKEAYQENKDIVKFY